MIVVTRLDGRKMALNVDRIERVERNETMNDTNIYFIGGARLTVAEAVDELIEQIIDAKSRVVARAFAMSAETAARTDLPGSSSPSAAQLRVVPPGTGEPR